MTEREHMEDVRPEVAGTAGEAHLVEASEAQAQAEYEIARAKAIAEGQSEEQFETCHRETLEQ